MGVMLVDKMRALDVVFLFVGDVIFYIFCGSGRWWKEPGRGFGRGVSQVYGFNVGGPAIFIPFFLRLPWLIMFIMLVLFCSS